MGDDVMGGVSDRAGGADAARPPAAEKGRLAWGVWRSVLEAMESDWLVAELRRRGDGRVTLVAPEAAEVFVDELVERARAEGYHAGVAAEAGLEGALAGRPAAPDGERPAGWVAATCAWLSAEAKAHRRSRRAPGDHADALEWTAEALWALSSAATELLGLIRAAGGGLVDGPHRRAVLQLEEALAADPLRAVQPPVPRGTCVAVGRGASNLCGAPTAPGEENLCARHAAEADDVGRLVLELVKRIRYAPPAGT